MLGNEGKISGKSVVLTRRLCSMYCQCRAAVAHRRSPQNPGSLPGKSPLPSRSLRPVCSGTPGSSHGRLRSRTLDCCLGSERIQCLPTSQTVGG